MWDFCFVCWCDFCSWGWGWVVVFGVVDGLDFCLDFLGLVLRSWFGVCWKFIGWCGLDYCLDWLELCFLECVWELGVGDCVGGNVFVCVLVGIWVCVLCCFYLYSFGVG